MIKTTSGLGLMAVLMMTTVSTSAQFNPYQYPTQKNVQSSKGAVVAAHPLAAEVGLSILKKGGNAVDAAIATQWALAVVYPGAGNIGGGGFMVARLKNGKNIALDYREKAPQLANKDMYLDSAGNPIEGLSENGALASGVPGTVAGLYASLKYARLPMKALLAPAIELAEKGFAITERQARELNQLKRDFTTFNNYPVAFVKKERWKTGDTLIQPELAATLRRIEKSGTKEFYTGKTAQMIVETMQSGKGIISLNDLKQYKAVERKALTFTYRGYAIMSMPLPSSGGIILQQVLKMIEPYEIASMPFQSAESVQLITEAERRSFADRAAYLGDADQVDVPVKQLLDSTYLSNRMKDYIPGKAGNSVATKAGVIPEHEETTHLSVIDQWGNAVSVTTTLNGSYGSRAVVKGAGFLLNNEMDDFSIKPGFPNMYGAVGAKANAIAPGKRMLSSMTPTIVLKNQQPFMVVGTPGGTTIPTSVIQSVINVIDYNMTAADAVNKPKFHHQWLPDEIFIEDDFNKDTEKQLKEMGYTLKHRGSIGRTELIKITTTPKKTIEAAADKRGDDHAAGQ
ncbi:MAG: gamma-glutamyltransferase [Ferruginibacter sp.]